MLFEIIPGIFSLRMFQYLWTSIYSRGIWFESYSGVEGSGGDSLFGFTVSEHAVVRGIRCVKMKDGFEST